MKRPCLRRAFTLIELLVSVGLLAGIMVLMVSITGQVQGTYRQTQGKAEQFRSAREAFEAMTRKLSQATLNTYWDYDNPDEPRRYMRQSELRFRTGKASDLLPSGLKTVTHAAFFQAPLGFVERAEFQGMENLLNTWGYFIEFGDDAGIRPAILPATYPLRQRFRLFEMMEASEKLSVYKYTSGNFAYNQFDWFLDPLRATPRPTRVLAENVLALVFWPKDPQNNSLTTDYAYDTAPDGNMATQAWSEHQLPPMVQVTMVVMDEASGQRLAERNGQTMPTLIQQQWFTESTQAKHEEDLGWMRRQLSGEFNAAEKVNYRVFTSTVSLRSARWSRE